MTTAPDWVRITVGMMGPKTLNALPAIPIADWARLDARERADQWEIYLQAAIASVDPYRRALDYAPLRAFWRAWKHTLAAEASPTYAALSLAFDAVGIALRWIAPAAIIVAIIYLVHAVLVAHGAAMPNVNAQQLAVALFLAFEAQGVKPSVRAIGRTMRDHGIRFREDNLRGWLRPFLDQRGASRTQEGASGRDGTQESLTRDADGRDCMRPVASGTHLRAHSKVSLVSSSSSTAAREAARDLAVWFLAAAVDAGAIGGHEALDPDLWATRTYALDAATRLLAAYSVDEIKARAGRLFAAKVARKIRRPMTLGVLAEQWDSDDVAHDEAPARRSGDNRAIPESVARLLGGLPK